MTAAEYNLHRLDLIARADALDAEQARVDREAPGTPLQAQTVVARHAGYAKLREELDDAQRRALEGMTPMTDSVH